MQRDLLKYSKFLLTVTAWLATSAFTITLAEKPGSAALAKAMQCRDAQQFECATEQLRQSLKQATDVETRTQVQYELGRLAVLGRAAPVTPVDGVALLQQAEKNGSLSALLTLGKAYQDGTGTPIDLAKAADYYQRASATNPQGWLELAKLRAGTPEAPALLGKYLKFLSTTPKIALDKYLAVARIYRDGTVVKTNPVEAERWYRKAIAGGEPKALDELATLWLSTNHQPANAVLPLWDQMEKLGNASAALKLGMSYEEGTITPREPAKATEYFERAVSLDPKLSYRISRFYEERQQPALALSWAERAAKLGVSDGYLKLARFYRDGVAVGQSNSIAKEMYQQAIQRGNPKAAIELIKMEQRERKHAEQRAKKDRERLKKMAEKARKGETSSDDDEAPQLAFTEWKKRADAGDAVAMREMGAALLQGRDTARDEAAGLEWLNKAAAQQDIPAMLMLAKASASGTNGGYSLKDAYEWYAKAATLNNPEAQYQLGLGYARGIGVEKNEAKAREWLSKAAQNGYVLANNILQSLTPADPK